MGGGAFIVAQRGTVYVTPGPYLPIAKRYARIARNRSKSKPDRQGMRRMLRARTLCYASPGARAAALCICSGFTERTVGASAVAPPPWPPRRHPWPGPRGRSSPGPCQPPPLRTVLSPPSDPPGPESPAAPPPAPSHPRRPCSERIHLALSRVPPLPWHDARRVHPQGAQLSLRPSRSHPRFIQLPRE